MSAAASRRPSILKMTSSAPTLNEIRRRKSVFFKIDEDESSADDNSSEGKTFINFKAIFVKIFYFSLKK